MVSLGKVNRTMKLLSSLGLRLVRVRINTSLGRLTSEVKEVYMRGKNRPPT